MAESNLHTFLYIFPSSCLYFYCKLATSSCSGATTCRKVEMKPAPRILKWINSEWQSMVGPAQTPALTAYTEVNRKLVWVYLARYCCVASFFAQLLLHCQHEFVSSPLWRTPSPNLQKLKFHIERLLLTTTAKLTITHTHTHFPPVLWKVECEWGTTATLVTDIRNHILASFPQTYFSYELVLGATLSH